MKKMLALILAFTCLFSLSVSAFAACERFATEETVPCTAGYRYTHGTAGYKHTHGEMDLPGIAPRAAVCPSCGQFSLTSSNSFSSWTYNGDEWRTCPTNPAYNDREQVRTVTNTASCRNCGFTSRSSYDEYRWYCVNRGYAHPN